jgi:hypothetical protein
VTRTKGSKVLGWKAGREEVCAQERDPPSQEAVGHHQQPVKRSNSSWMTKVATPADLGSSRTLDDPGERGHTGERYTHGLLAMRCKAGTQRKAQSGAPWPQAMDTGQLFLWGQGASWTQQGTEQCPWPPLTPCQELTPQGVMTNNVSGPHQVQV